MEVPRLGGLNRSYSCQPPQCWILNPPSKARDWTRNLVVTGRICFCCATTGIPNFNLNLNSPMWLLAAVLSEQFWNPGVVRIPRQKQYLYGCSLGRKELSKGEGRSNTYMNTAAENPGDRCSDFWCEWLVFSLWSLPRTEKTAWHVSVPPGP